MRALSAGSQRARVLVVAFDEKSLIYYRQIQQKPRNWLITSNASRAFHDSSVTHKLRDNKELCYAVRARSFQSHT